ncbi:hypothetical protein HPP92_021279 [Vanilla planifolia]|uniref:New component of the BRCA1-A complex n=1 Tax=Vanilla planifolia TaxID=51239 RepID=A0A835UIM1_VANPL|nr:hypothetical protein HPP92_021279 [Vanilla planifolia]
MEGAQAEIPRPAYSLPPSRLQSEDILFCVDVDAESSVEMKVSGSKGRPITRLDSIKQSLLLFVNSKLAINSDHRFSFTVLGQSISWLRKEFSNEIGVAMAAVQSLSSAALSYGSADLTQLFRIATQEAKNSRAQGRLLRVILIYCRSSMPPQHQWPISQKLFTLDVLYLHDKPGPENCPQKVFDMLIDALEHVSEYEGYIFESGQGLSRVLFRQMCILLAHPQQRCSQDELKIPKCLEKKLPTPTDPSPAEEGV